MNTKRKPFIARAALILLTILLISSMVGCATPTSAPAQPTEIVATEPPAPAEETEPPAVVETEAPEPVEPTAPAEAIEVTFPSHFWGESTHTAFFTEVVAEFEAENPGIKIVGSSVPVASYFDKTFAELTAGTPADIIVPFDPQMPQYLEAGLLEPLNPWLEEAGYDLDSFYPIAGLAEKDGQIYGISYGINPRVLMYNAQMFEDAGLGAPTNLDEFNEAIRTLRDPQQQQFGYATMATSSNANVTYLEIMPIIAGFGGAFVKDGQANATAPETVAALQWIKELYDEQLIPIGQDQTTYRSAFVQGKVASLTIGAFIYGVASNDNPEVASQLTATKLPFPGGGTISVNTFLAVPKDAKNKDAAARFLMKVLEDQWQPRITELTGAIPARPGMASEKYVQDNPWFQAVIDVADVAVSYAPGGAEQYAPEIMDIVVRHYESMLFTGLSAEEAAANMQAELEEFLASVQ